MLFSLRRDERCGRAPTGSGRANEPACGAERRGSSQSASRVPDQRPAASVAASIPQGPEQIWRSQPPTKTLKKNTQLPVLRPVRAQGRPRAHTGVRGVRRVRGVCSVHGVGRPGSGLESVSKVYAVCLAHWWFRTNTRLRQVAAWLISADKPRTPPPPRSPKPDPNGGVSSAVWLPLPRLKAPLKPAGKDVRTKVLSLLPGCQATSRGFRKLFFLSTYLTLNLHLICLCLSAKRSGSMSQSVTPDPPSPFCTFRHAARS